MKHRAPFRLLALLAVVAAFALTVMPARAWADTSLWTYTEPTTQTKIDVNNADAGAGEVTVEVVVQLSGETVETKSIEGVNITLAQVNIQVPEGYEVRLDTEGMSAAPGVDGNYNLGFDVTADTHRLVINILPTKIETQWGTLNFKNETQYADGYDLTVRLFVNGSNVYTTPKLRVAGFTSGGLEFDVNEDAGFHFLTGNGANDYDFHTSNPGSTWLPGTGFLSFSQADTDRNHNNTLDIFLWTFTDWVDLYVDREGAGDDVSDNMQGYEISYTLDGQRYAYVVTSFADDQPQIIPSGVEVTITAICRSGWEVTDWTCSRVDNTEFESNGNSAVLTSNLRDGEDVTIRATHICPMPEKPTFEEVENIFGNELVKVDCVNNTIDSEHEDKTYGPIAGGVEIGDVVNNNGTYIVTLTVTAPTYVGKYSSDVQVAHMLADGATDKHEVVLSYKGGKWNKADEFSPVVFEVMCSEVQDPKPELPTQDELAELTGAQVKVTCVADNIDHGSEEYAPIAGAYSFPKGVEGGAEQGYTATMFVNAAAYVDKFSTAERGEHALAAGEQDTKSVVLEYILAADGRGSWKLAGDAAPINFNVECVVEPEPEPEGPDTPGEDELDKLFDDSFVTVDCVNESAGHDDKTYGLIDGAYTVHHEKGATTATVVVSPYAYVNKYENEPDINKAHELVADSSKSTIFKLTYEDNAWTIDGANTVTYQVVCVDDAPVAPDQPTYDEILEATPQGAVTIDCTNTEVEHENKTYAIEMGAYTLGEVNDDDGDGVYTVDVQVSAGAYVLAFENDHDGIHHYLAPADQSAKTITLSYSAETETWSVAGDSASPVTFTVLCDVEGTTDPGTDPDEPGTDPDKPGDEGDEPGTNPDDKPGDGGQGNKPGDSSQGNGEDQSKGDGNANGNQGANGNAGTDSGEGKLSQTGDVATLLAAAIAGAGAIAVGAGYAAKRRK